ncbi:L-histidine N(alpha)-methyltransferase [Acidiferrobacter sp. SPIII_3]|jgi:L-histidine N-alpha-methyltransferase|uniref:L-histidine N(alpha)-methyltransferase n=1 Tax=Acidiferrobacter sp. SPIII_3 TaxID=1281578 RepID=UPI000D72AD08|nr:L-histidine N(alpha)-methyltransferase [Acidiferrobacter sp. SPIII_3]AWP23350.1 L-histidine N(alpha)-methyltransferase [Acidiferrobacter sp. SPIII_3]
MEQDMQSLKDFDVGRGVRPVTGVPLVHLPGSVRASGLDKDARWGLSRTPKRLPAKYFYDARGSLLFEHICATPEYYPTRTESALLERHACGILDQVAPGTLVEIGSGSSVKTNHFFVACERAGRCVRYQPFDVCDEALRAAAARLKRRYSWLEMELLVGDYAVDLPALPHSRGPRLFLFLGGTIGNLSHDEALSFLSALRATMHVEDYLLLGFDRIKDKHILDAAYNDARGYTAQFNMNLLRVLNTRLGADFDERQFMHVAFFNEDEGQIEMHLKARRAHAVTLARIGLVASFARDETILTEISRKFTPAGMRALLEAAGFGWCRHEESDNGYFSLVLAAPV